MSRSIPQPRQVRAGQQISARNTDAYREALSAVQGLTNRIKVSTPRPWSESMLHSVVSVQPDYITCVRVWRDGILGTKEVFVAKPQRIRGSETSRGAVTFSGYTADGQQRTATDPSGSEGQEVTPRYLAGDIIEVRVLRGKSGVPEADQQRARLVDRNVDGRAWAAIPA